MVLLSMTGRDKVLIPEHGTGRDCEFKWRFIKLMAGGSLGGFYLSVYGVWLVDW